MHRLLRDYRVKFNKQSETGGLIVSDAELISQLNLTQEEFNADENFIRSLAQTAQEEAEQYTGRQLLKGTFTNYFNFFTVPLRLYPPPFISITSVKFLRDNQTVEDVDLNRFVIDSSIEPTELRLAENETFPSGVAEEANSIRVTIESGYGVTPDKVPAPIKQATLLRAAQLFEQREPSVDERVNTFRKLLQYYRVRRF